ncbi:MAG: SRPBCC domain-containing protein [Myxococcales bacterium]|nr:SRPBCC domain-containing protein [Myxococcales bacterium]MCB9644926.1 SRPBCC domain-containing protein [Myxococcales bacterium]
MATESTQVEFFIPASPEEIFRSWLSSEGHTNMTGGKASIFATVGEPFSAWGGYIQGENLELVPAKKIVQHWRTADFAASDADSRVEIILTELEGGTKIEIFHTEIPEGQGPKYHQGWKEHYVEPMMSYFSGEDEE